ncbi:DUF6880 family protein [Xenorhabdus bovienii]|uniref:DUF6880 family protein n=1 Tax=Xenorhabdus bovienii TaxID=40576 RepID=UPI003DA52E4B
MMKNELSKKQSELLASFNKEELLEIIHVLIRNNELAQTTLVSGYLLESEDILKLIEKEYKKRSKSKRFFDYYETDIFFGELHSYMATLFDTIIPLKPAESEVLLSNMLQDFERLSETKDTSSGGWQDYYYYLVESWIKALSLQKDIDKVTVANKLFKIFQGEYYFSVSLLAEYKSTFGLDILRQLRDVFYQHKNDDEALELSYSIKDIEFFKTYLDKEKEFLYPRYYLDYAELLIEDVRSDEAIVLLENLREKNNKLPVELNDDKIMELLIKANIEDGKKEEARQLCIDAFKEYYNHRFYELYENTLDKDEKGSAIKLFLDIANQYEENRFFYLLFLIEVERFDVINDYVLNLGKDNIIKITDSIIPSTARKVSSLLYKSGFPLSATLVRRALVEDVLGRGASKYYKYAVSDLKKSLDYGEKIQSTDDIASNQTYLTALYAKHKKKASFWSLAEEKIKGVSMDKDGAYYGK